MERTEKFSRKRLAILNALRETKVHPTADWVYARLKPDYPDLSLGTVYRNLKRFCDNGQAVSLGVINGQEHFDGDISRHTHFVCTHCGAVLDIFDELFTDGSLKALSHSTGYEIESVSMLFRGACPQCAQKTQRITA